MHIKVLSVTQITEYIKRVINADVILSSVSLKGEISNFKHHYSGHMYFTLKDDNAKIKCVMFKNSNTSLKFLPEDGMSIIVTGNVSVYERDGQYQLYVNNMVPEGIGVLYAAYEQLKKKLEQEGLFDIGKKIPLPSIPSKIGVITSSTGAAVRDIINVATRRFPGIEILLVPVKVQGTEAKGEICEAIKLLNTRGDVDLIIAGRGGGSIEELWAFNEECVARAIYNSNIPVISAVGHETDFTISDFVSDLRAPTPSAAAELGVPDKKELLYKVNSYYRALCIALKAGADNKMAALKQKMNLLYSLNPVFQINQRRQHLDNINYKLVSLMKHKLDKDRDIVKNSSANLQSLSPLSILSRGYSISYLSECKSIVDDINKINCGDNMDVLVKNGIINCVVKDIKEEEIKYGS